MVAFSFSTIKDDEQRNEISVFYEKNKNRLYRIAYSKLGKREDAEDAVQETFSRIADNPDNLFEVSPQDRAAYVNTIVRNVAIDLYNREHKIQTEPLEDDELEEQSISLEDKFLAKVSRDEILSYVDSLPALQRSVLILHCLNNLSIDETAKVLNISLKAANRYLLLARKGIRSYVSERRKRYE